MSLSHRERSQLRATSQALARSGPSLTAMFAIFGRLTADEPLPAHEQLLGPAYLSGRAEPPGPAPPGRPPHRIPGVLARPARAAAAVFAPARRRRAGHPAAAPRSAPHPQEDRMSTTRHDSPLPPDHDPHGESPLPPDPRRGHGDSPLPPDPSARPSPAQDPPANTGPSAPGPARPEPGTSR